MRPTHIIIVIDNGYPRIATVAYSEEEAQKIAEEWDKAIIMVVNYSMRGE